MYPGCKPEVVANERNEQQSGAAVHADSVVGLEVNAGLGAGLTMKAKWHLAIVPDAQLVAHRLVCLK